MFGLNDKNKNEYNDEKSPHVNIIRKAGYYLPDSIINHTSISTLHYASILIRSRQLVLQEENYSFDDIVDSSKFIITDQPEQKRIIYTVYLAQKFVDMLFNERTGIYVYENKENLSFHLMYPELFKGYVKGNLVIRELEHITNMYSLSKDNYQPNIKNLGENLPEMFFLLRIAPEERKSYLMGAKYRGLTFLIPLGMSLPVFSDNKFNKWDLQNLLSEDARSTLSAIPDLTEENWGYFKKNIKDTYTPLSS